MIEIGERLEDQYRIEKLVGAGGMGLVYQARDEISGARVAVKVMRSTVIESETELARFHREAVALGKLDHPNIVRVLRVGVLPDGSPYMVMELLVGRDLRAELRERGVLPLPEAAAYVVQVCDAVAAAHHERIIHRDLKPQNMFLTALDGERKVKLLDFGVSKLTLDGEATATGTHEMLGTPHFMSPEQVRSSKHVDHRSDIWALGVVLYLLTTGRFPFARPSPTAVIAAIPFDDPTPPRELVPELPVALEALILRCLQKDPANRFQSAGELLAAVQPFALECVRVAGAAPLRSLPPISIPNSERIMRAATVRDQRRRRARGQPMEYSEASVSTKPQRQAQQDIAVDSMETIAEPQELIETLETLPSTRPQLRESPGRGPRTLLMAAGSALLLTMLAAGYVMSRTPPADSTPRALRPSEPERTPPRNPAIAEPTPAAVVVETSRGVAHSPAAPEADTGRAAPRTRRADEIHVRSARRLPATQPSRSEQAQMPAAPTPVGNPSHL